MAVAQGAGPGTAGQEAPVIPVCVPSPAADEGVGVVEGVAGPWLPLLAMAAHNGQLVASGS